MANKKNRMSLMDLKRADEIKEKNIESIVSNAAPLKNKIEKTANGEHEKLSVAIPVDTFEMLQDISRKRRKLKQKYTMSHMVREALELWLKDKHK